MPANQPDAPLRAGALLRQPVRDLEGRIIGRVADIETTRDSDGHERVTALIVTTGRWGRLLGYERHEAGGPWLLEHLARIVLRGHLTRVPWHDARL
ncbi:PRC-barrel domain containing protein [Micromonospora sp. DR5-3]|uniref:PRC-barrel domain containing protein n=1 Tax=unclassified Micromonospora TaxID=2617518 RepID=UPI0011D39E8E|nr:MULTISPECIES: PRC-barrel domain containing protein [unclassified Micromonospora]MCW3819310.1 PRC-barrel domain containing protein [Micromonospora sp. DR5-3]TYC21753.1 PRC-barrel domain containing protein [Micromonospora sp. MP36]